MATELFNLVFNFKRGLLGGPLVLERTCNHLDIICVSFGSVTNSFLRDNPATFADFRNVARLFLLKETLIGIAYQSFSSAGPWRIVRSRRVKRIDGEFTQSRTPHAPL